jgi:hypothetical protein
MAKPFKSRVRAREMRWMSQMKTPLTHIHDSVIRKMHTTNFSKKNKA